MWFYCIEHGRFFIPKLDDETMEQYVTRASVYVQYPCPKCGRIGEKCRCPNPV